MEGEIENNGNGGNEPQYICDVCNSQLPDYISLLDHKLIFHDGAFNEDTYNCAICGLIFNDEDDYYDHLDNTHPQNNQQNDENVHVNDDNNIIHEENEENEEENEIDEEDENDEDNEDNREILVDNIRTSLNGRFQCPICSNKYNTQFHLGEHFYISHGSYSDQSILDEEKKGNFPGIGVLEHIGMIDVFHKTKTCETECQICSCEYTNEMCLKIEKNRCIEDFDDIEKGYCSDNDNYKKNKLFYKHYHEDNDNINQIIITDSDLFKKSILKFGLAGKMIRLKCCNKYICSECLENYIIFSNNIICPYCKHDHNRYDQKYIIIIEPTKCNKYHWRNWWKRHIDIFF